MPKKAINFYNGYLIIFSKADEIEMTDLFGIEKLACLSIL